MNDTLETANTSFFLPENKEEFYSLVSQFFPKVIVIEDAVNPGYIKLVMPYNYPSYLDRDEGDFLDLSDPRDFQFFIMGYVSIDCPVAFYTLYLEVPSYYSFDVFVSTYVRRSDNYIEELQAVSVIEDSKAFLKGNV